ncbi:MAG: ribosome assembly factor SBDS [Candidatus Aenigmatarchaeota archaeon]|nr:MAG: ribosome assembly factor SBDS [Candidatus Aenigmarchaeota archaeon]
MVSTEKAVVARLESHGKKFEILVDPDAAVRVKKGDDVTVKDLVVYENVYEDAKKGTRHTDADVRAVFGTQDFKEIAYRIIRKGEVQLTTDQRRKMKEAKVLEIAALISKRAVDPKTKAPHPAQRIINAMEQAHVNVNEYEPAVSQVERVIDALRPILPLSVEQLDLQVRIPASYVGKAYGRVRDFGHLKKEEWRSDGSWVGTVEIPAGMQGDFYSLLSGLTHGEGEAKPLAK